MAAVCIWYKEEQKGNKTGMNQDRVYENRRNSYQGNPMERPEPFFAAQPLWGRSMAEHLICSGWWRQSVTAWITAAA